MKKKVLIIVLVILAIVIISFIGYKVYKDKHTENVYVKASDKNSSKTGEDVANKFTNNGQNGAVIIGQSDLIGDYYSTVSVKLNEATTKEGSVKALIQGVSDAIGYTIEVNSVSVDGNDIKIDFSSNAAPQNNETSYFGLGYETYHIISPNGVAKTIFDSIKKTLNNYYGNDINIYYSIDGNDIYIDNISPAIQINKDEAY